MTIYLAPLVALAGVLLYALPTSAKVQELGRIAFFVGLLATLLTLGAGRAYHL